MPVSTSVPLAPAGFHIREANLRDVEDLTRLWFLSFNPSHKFWDVVTPQDQATRQWFIDVWAMGIAAGPEVLRTWVVEDLGQDKRLAAFARWSVPRADGLQDIPLPEYPKTWDPELTAALWDGMPRNRSAVMGARPHWMLEFLGVDAEYQNRGLGFALVDWGCREADSAGLEVYLDATIRGLPFYKKNFGFEDRKVLDIPVRPDSFGTYELMAVVRAARIRELTLLQEKSGLQGTTIEVMEIVEA
ncbi:hypothetical protein JX265_005724 [Neoarthrinium moseri]|uniref:N-acetyltransferase domain-containing protein n=1 Tax=Neoarthrinium moseri TaxID=1658444 RepID=A0A9P9WNK8_9PEZI|nr:hypothetical protein JX265_005724 [Neoarthrinium moseri]